jgi:hypothetical protein
LKAASAEVESLKPKAVEYDKIDSFVRNAGLSQNDVAGTLEIAALMRSSPPQALARLEPMVVQLRMMWVKRFRPICRRGLTRGISPKRMRRRSPRRKPARGLQPKRISRLAAGAAGRSGIQ